MVASVIILVLLLVLLSGTIYWVLSEQRLAVPLPLRRRTAASVVAGLVILGISGCGRIAESSSVRSLISPARGDGAFDKAIGTWDVDRNGEVTCQEWQGYAARLFERFDTDSDGYLTGTEYRTLSVTDRLFDTVGYKYFDWDRDGQISRTELVDKPNPAFERWDKDRNCVLEVFEMPPRQRPTPPQRPGQGPGQGRAPGGPPI